MQCFGGRRSSAEWARSRAADRAPSCGVPACFFALCRRDVNELFRDVCSCSDGYPSSRTPPSLEVENLTTHTHESHGHPAPTVYSPVECLTWD